MSAFAGALGSAIGALALLAASLIFGASQPARASDDGGRWPSLVPAGCFFFEAGQGVWTGRQLLVWGLQRCGSSLTNTGAAYSPNTNSWTPIAAAPLERSYETMLDACCCLADSCSS